MYDAADAFRRHWAFDRKESGLTQNLTSKWVCPARAGRVGCYARPETIQGAIDLGMPLITPPTDWQDRPCCVNKTIDFTPDHRPILGPATSLGAITKLERLLRPRCGHRIAAR